MKLATLRHRREFLRIRGGGRSSTHAFVLEGKRRHTETADVMRATDVNGRPRFGFTVTKRLGNAVRRNRIRRRLKAALCEVAMIAAKDHFDYVLIARQPAFDMPFEELVSLLEKSFERIHRPRQKPNKRAIGSDMKNKSGAVTR
jgi:ribonuclease P protein component